QFQETITHDDFTRLLENVYAPENAAQPFITINTDSAAILASGTNIYTLRFANAGATKPVPRYWTPAAAMPAPKRDDRPLSGVSIALDPGHLGGHWAKMEERW